MSGVESTGANASSDKQQESDGYIPGDSAWAQCRNIYAAVTGKMTPEALERFRVDTDIRNEAQDCKNCEDQRDYLLKYSEHPFNIASPKD